jgi:hypothetical protein
MRSCIAALILCSCGADRPTVTGENVKRTASALVSPTWAATGAMTVARQNHVAVLLPNGSVLVAGGNVAGSGSPTASAELYVPGADIRISGLPAMNGWTSVASMNVARDNFAACLLATGLVLVAGGEGLSSAELFNPTANTWTMTGSMAVARQGHQMTCLPDGRALVTGGAPSPTGASRSSAEIYDPSSGTWSSAGSMPFAVQGHQQVMLSDGRALVVGGWNSGAQNGAALWDPATGSWTSTGSMATARAWHTLHLLNSTSAPNANGKVLAAGGLQTGKASLNTAEIYDPSTGAWSAAANLNSYRYHAAGVTLAAGPLVVGGLNAIVPHAQPYASAESYDVAQNIWTQVPIPTGTFNETATALTPTSVLVAGGNPSNVPTTTTTTSQIYGICATQADGAQCDAGNPSLTGVCLKQTCVPNTMCQQNNLPYSYCPLNHNMLYSCPGPVGGRGEINVEAYGALPTRGDGGDGVADAYPGIQAAINAACPSTDGLGPPPVFLPAGTYSLSQPLVITCGAQLYGAGRGVTVLRPTFRGPAIFLAPAGDNIGYAAPLRGNGASMKMAGRGTGAVNHIHLNLRDVPSVELDGLAQFTAEAFVEQTASANDNINIVGSPDSGNRIGAFSLWISSQTLSGRMFVGSQQYTLMDAKPMQLNTVYHVALTYDGTMIRLFRDGAMVAFQPVSGLMHQKPYEDVMLGNDTGQLEAGGSMNSLVGAVDSVRLSDVARYGATCMPSAPCTFSKPTNKLANDAHTLALLNFATQPSGFTIVDTRDGPFWLPVERSYDTNDNFLIGAYGARIHDLTVVGGSGIVGWASRYMHMHQIDCIGCDLGISIFQNDSESQLDDVFASACATRGRFGVFTYTANAKGYNNLQLFGQVYPFVVQSGAEQVATNVQIYAGPATVNAVHLWDSQNVFDGLLVDTTNAGAPWLGAITADNGEPNKLQLQGSTIGNAGNGIPITLTTSGAGLLVEGTSFTGTSGAPEVVHIAATQAHPNIIVGSTKDSNVPWSDDKNLVSVATDPGTVPNPTQIPADDPVPPVMAGLVPASNIFDITSSSYGAKSDGSDSSDSIQKAITDACTQGSSTVFIPVGTFNVAKPLLVNCNDITISGAGHRSVVTGWPASWQLPAFVLNPHNMTGLDLVTPGLVPPSGGGTGSAMQTDGASEWIDLRDATSVELDGLGAFTAEAFVKPSTTPTGYGGIVQSYGCLGTAPSLPGCTSAFSLAMNGPNLVGSLTVNGTSYALPGPALSLNTIHHVGLQYDGTTINLLLDGNSVACAGPGSGCSQKLTMSGHVTQALHEDVTIGPRTGGFDAAVQDPAMPGIIDSVRLSNKVRWSVPYTKPSTKLTVDSNALILANFEAAPSGTTLARVGSGAAEYFAVRRTAEPNPKTLDRGGGTAEGTLTGVTFRNLTLGSTLFGMNATGSHFLNYYTGNTDQGIVLDGTSANSVFDNVELEAGGRGRFGLVMVNGDGNVYHNLSDVGAQMPLVVYGGANQTFTHTFVTPNQATSVWGSILLHSGDTMEGLYYDNESSLPVGKGDLLVIDPIAPFQLFKGEIDVPSTMGMVPITVDGGKGLLLEGTFCGLTSSATPELIDVVTPPTSGGVTALGVWSDSSVPLSNWPGVQSIGN